MNCKNYSGYLCGIAIFAATIIIGSLTGCAETTANTSYADKIVQQVNGVDASAAVDNVVGDWMGELQIPNSSLRLWLTVERDVEGNLQASLDSLDQAPGKKMAVGDISIQDNQLSFKIPKISASYRGEWNEQTQQWQGRFNQGRSFELNFTRGKPKADPIYPELNGNWQAEISGHPLIVRIESNKMGTKAVLDSPDEGVTGLPISALTFSNGEISFLIATAKVTFKGTVAGSASQFSGQWLQQGQPRRQLTFVKLADLSTQHAPKRPQHPTGQQPYQSEPVRFKNTQATGVELAGTLTLPEGQGPFAAAILISGSGPQDRDESFMGHKPFAVIADYLTRNGIAVLRYDDRGIEQSIGDYYSATSLDFASDANAAFDYLSNREDINVNAIGMIGHSEGGLIAPLAADINKKIAFIVLLAGPGVKTPDLMLAQQEAMARLQNVPEEKINKMMAISRQIMESVRKSPNEEAAIKTVTEILSAENLAILGTPDTAKADFVAAVTSAWYRYFMSYDPARYFADKALPILALNGELDVQVPAEQNLAGLKIILSDHVDATVKQLPGLNHMFQQAKTGSMAEYREIEQTFSPDALELMSAWINARF